MILAFDVMQSVRCSDAWTQDQDGYREKDRDKDNDGDKDSNEHKDRFEH